MMQAQTVQNRVLVLDTDRRRAAELSDTLRVLNYEPITGCVDGSLHRLCDATDVAVMIGDMPAGQGVGRAFQAAAEQRHSLPVLRVAGGEIAATIDEQLEHHHTWELDAPVISSQLEFLLKRAERYRGRERRMRITGKSPSIRSVRRLIEKVADFDTSVLITGESGTGKELVARTVHDLSNRSDGPFVPINCGAIPAELLESELFGHEKGAFTGAVSARKGRFELAEGGTLFLDEIGDMSLPMQAKLLRVLQERCYERVGGTRTRQCDVRIVAATHRDLPKLVEAGEFREDLFYRLNVFPIEMPPLRRRITDLPALLGELLVQHCGSDKGSLRLHKDAIRALRNYAWPGNIRELSNLVERLAILHPSGQIGLEDLPEKYRKQVHDDSGRDALRLDVCADDGSRLTLRDRLQHIEKRIIQTALRDADNVVARAARSLKLRRTTLVEKINKYGLNEQDTGVNRP